MTYSVSLANSINPLFFALLALGILLLGKSIYTLIKFPELKSKSIKEIVVGSIVMIAVLVIFLIVPFLSVITIHDEYLEVRLATGFKTVSVTKDAIDSARVITLNTDTDTTIDDKIVGTSTRDYREGTFLLQNGSEASVLLSGDQALLIKAGDQTLLLAPKEFDTFVNDFSNTLFPVN